MGLSSILELALGMVLIYYVLGLVVSYITNEIKERSEMRAKDLARELKLLLGTEDNGEIYTRFMAHPMIQSLAPKRAPLVGSPKPCRVADIPPQRAALVLIDILFSGRNGEKSVGGAEIRRTIATMPDGELKRALQKLLDEGLYDIRNTGYLIEQMFNDTLETVSSIYKQHIRQVVVIFALVVTLMTGIDSVEVAQRLWLEPTLRAELVARANQVTETEDEQAVGLADLELLNIPVFWTGALPANGVDWVWKVIGLLITWLAVAQGSSFWYQILKQVRSGASESGDSEHKITPAPIVPVVSRSQPSTLPGNGSQSEPPITPEDVERYPEVDIISEKEFLPMAERVEVIEVDEKLVQLALAVLDKLQARRPNTEINLKIATAQLKIEAVRQNLTVTSDQITAALRRAIHQRQGTPD